MQTQDTINIQPCGMDKLRNIIQDRTHWIIFPGPNAKDFVHALTKVYSPAPGSSFGVLVTPGPVPALLLCEKQYCDRKRINKLLRRNGGLDTVPKGKDIIIAGGSALMEKLCVGWLAGIMQAGAAATN